jgi:hypothetical protein
MMQVKPLSPYSLISSLGYRLLKNRGVFFYLLFIGYLIAVHPGLIERLSDVSLANPDPLLGWIFLLLPFFELAGAWLKYPVLRYYARKYPLRRSNWTIIVIIFLPILHLGMSAFLFIIGGQIAGLQPEGDAAWYWQLLWVAGFFLVLIKEIGFLAIFFSFTGMEWTGRQQYPPDVLFLRRLRKQIEEIRLQDLWEDSLGDVCLLLFSTLGYTAVWEYVGISLPFNAHAGFAEYFWQLLGVLLYFMMVIPPLRAVYLLQNAIARVTRKQKLWTRFQFALTLAAAFFSITRR